MLGLASCLGLQPHDPRDPGWEDLEAGSPSRQQAYVLFGDFGGLSHSSLRTNALPWKLVAAALALDGLDPNRSSPPPDRQRLQEALRRRLTASGLLYPRSVANWSGDRLLPPFTRPAGLVTAPVGLPVAPLEIEAVNLGCAACHAGVTYDGKGRPQPDLWLGLPNTSFDSESYTDTVFQALRRGLERRQDLVRAMDTLFPETDAGERWTLRYLVLPRTRDRLAELGTPLPFHGGLPGLTHGVAALKQRLDLLGPNALTEEHGFSAIPDLAGRQLRSSLLYDGAYAPPGKPRFRPLDGASVTPGHVVELAATVHFFTVPTMGIEPGHLRPTAESMAAVTGLLTRYRPPPFPGEVNRGRASRGEEVFLAHCARCHGEHGDLSGPPPLPLLRFPNRLSPGSEIGTDPQRWRSFDSDLADAVNGSAYAGRVDAARTGGYVANPLSGLWATAPYLHNNSVPSVWSLMHPEERPERFLVGGHALDLERLGIDYPEGYTPWSRPRLHDTTLPGLGNAGHESPFDLLAEEEKLDLLEYLKLL